MCLDCAHRKVKNLLTADYLTFLMSTANISYADMTKQMQELDEEIKVIEVELYPAGQDEGKDLFKNGPPSQDDEGLGKACIQADRQC